MFLRKLRNRGKEEKKEKDGELLSIAPGKAGAKE